MMNFPPKVLSPGRKIHQNAPLCILSKHGEPTEGMPARRDFLTVGLGPINRAEKIMTLNSDN
jgi:hypothetical protein